MHYPDALSQGDPRPWPARHGCPVGRFRHLEVVYPRDVLDNAVSGLRHGPKCPPGRRNVS
jgi:hypothetical protein